MKKLFIVLGSASAEEKQFCQQLMDELGKNNVCVVSIETDDPQPALRHTLAALRSQTTNYNDVLVIYSGANLYLFPDNIPCDKYDIVKLKKYAIEAIGGCQNPREKEAVQNIFTAMILRLLDPKPIKNLREIAMNNN